MSPDHRIRELEELVVRLIGERDAALERQRELESKYKTLEERNKELENKLSFYEGPNVPPSVKTIKKKEKKEKPSGKKRGAPKGHRGATRKTPPPERVVDVSAVQCPECHQHPGGSVGTETSTVEDIIPPRSSGSRSPGSTCTGTGASTATTSSPRSTRTARRWASSGRTCWCTSPCSSST